MKTTDAPNLAPQLSQDFEQDLVVDLVKAYKDLDQAKNKLISTSCNTEEIEIISFLQELIKEQVANGDSASDQTTNENSNCSTRSIR